MPEISRLPHLPESLTTKNKINDEMRSLLVKNNINDIIKNEKRVHYLFYAMFYKALISVNNNEENIWQT